MNFARFLNWLTAETLFVNNLEKLAGNSNCAKQSQIIFEISLTASNDKLAFQCPFCPLKVSFGLRRNHLAKHFYAQLSAEVAEKSQCSEEPPYSCYLCRHVAMDRNGLIKHVGVTHKVVDQFVKDSVEAFQGPQVKDSEDSQSKNTHGVECRLCDKPQHFR